MTVTKYSTGCAAEHHAKQDGHHTSALVATIRTLSHARTVPTIMEIVTHTARELLWADGITFVLRDGSQCYYAEEDAIAPLWKGRRFPMESCISGWCMGERKTVAIRDIYADPRIPHGAYRPTFVRSLAMVPVRMEDPIGAMGAYWSNVRNIVPDNVDLLQTIANAAALAVANIELEQEQEKAHKARIELSHRLGNILSVVGSVARQTARSTASLDEFAEIFTGRLEALSRAQLRLRDTGTPGADLLRLIREQLFMSDCNDRIVCTGPNVFIGADEAFELGLVLHELGTNARKYGSLSTDSGRVTIEWRLQPHGERTLELLWREEGGPSVEEPKGCGFGSAVIRSAFRKIGGKVQVDFEPQGVICRMLVPLTIGSH